MFLDWLTKIPTLLTRRQRLLEQNVAVLAAAVARLELASQRASTLPLTSRPCSQADVLSDWHHGWCDAMRETPELHRKQWEYCFILQALSERGCIAPGKRGLGFGVGSEPLAAVMAARGASIVATDMDRAAAARDGWIATGQHADSVSALNARGICPAADFSRLVEYRVVDMNTLPRDLEGFDFVWSSCALEHLGSLERGMRFVLESARSLRPGGVAVHTTEFNASSNDRTVERGATVLYRRRDLERLGEELERRGCALEPLDFAAGEGALDRYVDIPPYKGGIHLRRPYYDHSITSFGLIVRAGQPPE